MASGGCARAKLGGELAGRGVHGLGVVVVVLVSVVLFCSCSLVTYGTSPGSIAVCVGDKPEVKSRRVSPRVESLSPVAHRCRRN